MTAVVRPALTQSAKPSRVRFLARVNPVTKLLAAMVVTTPLLFSIDWVSAFVALALELLLFLMAGIGPLTIVRRAWPVLLAAPFAGMSMLLYGRPSGELYWSFLLIRVTDGSIELAVAIVIRVLAIGLPAVLLFLKVDPTDLADGLAQVARLPHRFVLGALAGTRMVGLLLDDWRSMTLSRRARGLGDHGVLRRYATMVFALLVLSIRRGSKLATAMEARGFGSSISRTWARESTIGRPDAMLLTIAVGVAAVALLAAGFAGTLHPVWAS